MVVLKEVSYEEYITKTFRTNANTVELHLSGLIGTAKHPDKQKIWIMEFLFENNLHWQSGEGKKILQTTILGYIFI